MARKEKNTRLFYNDEKHLKVYKSLQPEQFKELILAMLTYQYGDEDFVNNIKDPVAKALFIGEKVDIDRNEEKYEEIRRKRSEAGKNGGRPPKTEEPVIEVTKEEDTNKVEEDDKVKEWYVQVKRNDSERFFNSTYSQHFHTIDDAKEALMKYYNKRYKPSWLL